MKQKVSSTTYMPSFLMQILLILKLFKTAEFRKIYIQKREGSIKNFISNEHMEDNV